MEQMLSKNHWLDLKIMFPLAFESSIDRLTLVFIDDRSVSDIYILSNLV